MTKDIRWQQRFSNYKKALLQLKEAVDLSKERALSNLEQQGLIQAFEYTHELAWNTLKDYLQYQGHLQINGSRDATREAFKMGLISDGEGWMDMIKSRNQSNHTYNEKTADQISKKIVAIYHALFSALEAKMEIYVCEMSDELFEKEL